MTGGWPDNGEGYYSRKLSYKDWYEFNSAMRAHQNLVEAMPYNTILVLLAGLIVPRLALFTSSLNVFARFIYSCLYVKYGPRGRWVGIILSNGSMIATTVSSMYYGVQMYLAMA
uniref:Uncharacterized protein n=1 Tax=Strombidinopsis acuminata TaxID=141414 RepID=A0A7S3TJ23_9SPIT|mmetsp:Transcript_66176/g.91584  ORF Transcript_66176/g.91584 Transcript_66176/m.91584 type:complete len:114 (+) Transcript_66176:180-521(+)